jgi:hypothetical protein
MHYALWNYIIQQMTAKAAQLIWQRATGWTAGVRFYEGARFSLLHSVQTVSEAHPASNSMGNRYAAGAWTWKLTSI